jgi:hypothetical protein
VPGGNDVIIASSNSVTVQTLIPNGQLILYPGSLSPYLELFAAPAKQFLNWQGAPAA